MKFPTTKGQSDTFKLLIAAVVAMAILAIVASVLSMIDPSQLGCVSDPLNELTSKMSTALGGLDEASTGTLCLKSGSVLGSRGIINRISGVKTVTFECKDSAAICTGANAKVEVTSSTVKASKGDAQFKAIIVCTASGSDYDCTVGIRSPTDL